MDLISEQVEELRTISNNLSIGHNMPISLAIERFREAADTIESLSEKLQSENMEQTVDDCNNCIGWDSIHGGCTIHSTIPGGCTDFCNIKNSLEDCSGKWIPCKDRMPDTRCNILICQRDGYVSVGYYSQGKFLDLNSYPFDDVIAWQPLPKPYREEPNK